jgi:hypothetical protein
MEADAAAGPTARLEGALCFKRCSGLRDARACWDAYDFKFCNRCSFDTLEEIRIVRWEELFRPAELRPFRSYCHNMAISVAGRQ